MLFAGDLNLYTSNEEAYIALTDNTNPIVMIDPIDGPAPPFPDDGIDYFDPANYNINYFWRSSAFANVHTQSNRTTNEGFIDDSYETYGNHGNCYNSYINNTSCSGSYTRASRNALNRV